MAREHQAVKNTREGYRRRMDAWDRFKISTILIALFTASFISKVNAPFITPSEAFGETLRALWWLPIVLFFEGLRQIHYYVSEQSNRYNRFWGDKVFGRIERSTQRRFSPWFRFRVGRYVRITFYLLIVGVIANYLSDEWNSPVEALIGMPRWFVSNLASIAQFLFVMFFVVAQFAMLFWFLSRGGVKYIMPEEIETRYEDVWGQDHVVDLVRENMGFLEKPDEIEAKGGYVPGGILLWGPPGTGKTLIAEATAGEVGVPFVFVEPGAFTNMFFGVGILKVKGLFRKLRKLSLRHGGVVAFFDEADSLGSRGSLSQGGVGQPYDALRKEMSCNGIAYMGPHVADLLADEYGIEAVPDETPHPHFIDRIIMGGMGGGGGGMGTLQALLTEMSGLKQPRGISNRVRKALGVKPKPPPKYRIFIMMASNMPNALDPALLRPGRLDRIYKVGYPTKEGRVATLHGYFHKIQHRLLPEQIEELAVKTPYYTGAKIKDLVNEALILSMRDDREVVEWQDVWKAKTLKEMGPAEGFEYVDREGFAVAIHEASHAVAAHLLRTHAEIDIATIERRGDIGGFVSGIPLEDRFTSWMSEMEVDIKVSLASLVGERIFFEGDNSSGVGGDLRNATAVVSRMVGMWGMGDTIASMAGLPQGLLDQPPDKTGKIVRSMRAQVEKRLQTLYEETAELLEEYKEEVLAVAMLLQERKTISGTDISAVLGTDSGSLTKARPTGYGKVDPDVARAMLPEERRSAMGNGGTKPAIDTAGNGQPGEPAPVEDPQAE